MFTLYSFVSFATSKRPNMAAERLNVSPQLCRLGQQRVCFVVSPGFCVGTRIPKALRPGHAVANWRLGPRTNDNQRRGRLVRPLVSCGDSS